MRRRQKLNRRPLCQAAAGFTFGVTFFLTKEWSFLLAAGILSGVCSVEYVRKQRPDCLLLRNAVFMCMFLLGMKMAGIQAAQVAAYQSAVGEKQPVVCQGRIYRKESKNDQTVIYLKSCIFQIESKKSTTYSCNHILVYFDADSYPIGKTIVVKGVLMPLAEARNEGNFDEKSYDASRKIDFKVTGAQVLGVYGKTDWFAEKLSVLAERLRSVYDREMSPKNAGVLTGMVLGDKSSMDTEIKSMYQKSGLSHVLCVSGLHLSVIGMTLYRFLKKRGFSYQMAGGICGGIVFCFAFMSGFEVSAKRAFFMFVLLLLANGIGRSYDSMTALAVSGMVFLMENPFLIFHTGFLFSFGAVAGVVVVGNALVDGWVPKSGLVKKILTSTGIQLVTLPLVCSFYFEIPIYAVLINLILLPFMGAVLCGGLIGGVLGIFAPPLAHVILWLPDSLLWCYEKVCNLFLAFPYAQWITGSPGKIRLIIYYSLLAFGLFCISRQSERMDNAKEDTDKTDSTGSIWKKRLCLFFGIAALILLLLIPHRKQMEIDILDVGQGDGIYLCTKDGVSMFVDGGSSSVSGVGTYRILPFLKAKGIRKIDYWFISHTDMDHVNGLEEILRTGYPVGTIVFSAQVYRDAAYDALKQEIGERQIAIRFMKAGDSLKTETDRLTCIFPTEDYPVLDANAGSMVLLYETDGFRGLFTGDISATEENFLVNQKKLPELSFYKAAHHGSNYSNSEEFLRELSPEICVVSCGKNNRYGHPGKDAVARMEEHTSAIYYTMQGGRIRIWKKRDGFAVQNYGKPLEVKEYPVLK